MTGGSRTVHPLACAACGKPFEPGLVFERQGQASCRTCGAILDLHQPRGPGARALAPAGALARARPDVPMPGDVTVVEDAGRLAVTCPVQPVFGLWTVLPVGLGALAALALLGGLVRGADLLAFVPLAVPFVLGGAYTVATVFLNRVRVTVANGEVAVGSGPLPWPSAFRVQAKHVQQVFCEERMAPDGAGHPVGRSYGVSAVVGPEGRRLVLLAGLPSAALAFWLEHALEHALGIEDRPVGGEAPR